MIARSILIRGVSVSIMARAGNPYALFVIRLQTFVRDYVSVARMELHYRGRTLDRKESYF